jgi:hypothetical protein
MAANIKTQLAARLQRFLTWCLISGSCGKPSKARR